MPGNRSFVDFGRIPLLRNFPDFRPIDPMPSLTVEMIQRMRTHLNQNYPARQVSFGTPRMEDNPFRASFHTHFSDYFFPPRVIGDPDEIAAAAVESHTPQTEERPLTRKESFAAWQKRSTALIEEHRRGHE